MAYRNPKTRDRAHGRGAARCGRGRRIVDDQGPRLRPWRRPLAIRGLRVRQARPRLQAHPRPLLPADQGRARPAASRSGCCSGRAAARSASAAPAAPAASGSARPRATRSPPRAAASCCARGGRRLERCGKEGKAGERRCGSAASGGYRGSLVARNDGGSLQVINQLGLEGYVKGVVANEVPSSWPQQALRAQAVVARSYGVATSRGGRLRPLRRHPQPGLRRTGLGDRARPTRPSPATRARGGQVPRRGRRHLLLLHLGRSDRELRVRLLRRQQRAVPEVRRRPVRRRLAGPQVERAALRRRDGVGALGPVRGRAEADRRDRARQPRRGSSAPASSAPAGSDHGHRATRCARASACARPGRGSSTAEPAPAQPSG